MDVGLGHVKNLTTESAEVNLRTQL